MIIFKTIVPDKQVEDYVRPEGTKKYECGAGINCAFCTLKMLGVYNDELEETSKTCGPRYRSGKVIQPQEYLSIAKQVIADMTEEHHELELAYEYGQPSTSLAKIVSHLHPAEACFFVYGRTGVGGHAVVLRKDQDGVVELVDPQRGSDDIGKEYGFSPAQVAELGIKATPQYYRVQGIPAIEEAMIEQSVLFKYWNSKKELLEDLPNFVVGALMIDSVAGLKMLIDDPASGALATKMEEDEEYPPAPKSSKMEVDMQGGGKNAVDENIFYITDDEVSDSAKMSKFFKASLQAMKEEEAAETETEEAVTEPDVDPELFQTIVKLLGKPDGTDVITHLLELPEEEFEEEAEEQTGGAAVMITPEEYKSQIQRYWADNQGADRVNSTFFLIKKALELYNVERTRISKKGILVGFEYPNPTNQCKKVGRDAVGNVCWLCGGFAPYKWENLKPESQMGLCKLIFNRKECEHILPINLMYFLKTLVNTKVPPTTAIQIKLRDMLYDNSCKLCNGKKDNGLYIRTQTVDGDIEPHIPNILSEVITFFTVYGSTSIPCNAGGGNMGTVPPALASVGSLVHVKGKYYPNVIRAQLSPGFEYKPLGTVQATQAEKASKLLGPAQLLSGIQTKYPEAYQKLTSEPDITKLTTSPFGQEVLPHVTAILKGKLHTAASLEGPFKETARVDQKVAVDWVLRRFCIIYDRIKAICNVLNSRDGKDLWHTQTQSILSGTGQPIEQIKVLATRNNGPESERIRIERTTNKGSVAEESDEDKSPPPPPPAKRSRAEEERENTGQEDDIEPPSAKRGRRGGHIDISVHRGGRRVIDVEL